MLGRVKLVHPLPVYYLCYTVNYSSFEFDHKNFSFEKG